MKVNQVICERLTKDEMQEGGRLLGILRNGTLIFGNEEVLPILMDFCIHEVRRRGRTAVEAHFDEMPYPDGSDEALFLRSLKESYYSLFAVQATEPGVGLQIRDVVRGHDLKLVDVGLSQTASRGLVIATRLINLDGMHATSGAAIPMGAHSGPDLSERISALAEIARPLLGNPESAEKRSAAIAGLIAMCLREGRADHIDYREPGAPISPPASWRHDRVVAENSSSERVGRNAPCPCGSGKKFKHCHGGSH